MPVHHHANLGWTLGTCALWRAHMERRREVPYTTVVTPASVVEAGEPSYQPAQPEPPPKCLCGAMTVKTGAIVIGALNLIAFGVTGLALLIVMIDLWKLDGRPICGLVLAVTTWVAFNSLLVHGARTGSHCLVVSWLAFQATATGVASISFVIAVMIFLQTPFEWRITITITLVGGAILALQWYFFVVGMSLANHLSRKKGTVVQVGRLATGVALPAHQPQQAQFLPQQPQFQTQQPQFQTQQAQFLPQQPQFQTLQPQFLPQQPQFLPQQPQFQTQQPQFQPQHVQHQLQPQDAPPPYSFPPPYSSDLTSPITPALQNEPSPVTKKDLQ